MSIPGICEAGLMDRLLSESVRVESGCLRWTGRHMNQGYGVLSVTPGNKQLVHRVSYELHHGEIPPEFTVDHVAERGCLYRDCIEPTHLESVTRAENTRRANVRTSCLAGHPYEAGSFTVDARGKRRCRQCDRARYRTGNAGRPIKAGSLPWLRAWYDTRYERNALVRVGDEKCFITSARAGKVNVYPIHGGPRMTVNPSEVRFS